jgi:uncharacterized membrane protein (UPF0136 family)
VQESAFLLSSIAMLLAGMIFTSRGFAPGSTGYLLLTIVAAGLIILSVGVFLALLCFEVYRSIKVRKFLPRLRHRAQGRSRRSESSALTAFHIGAHTYVLDRR